MKHSADPKKEPPSLIASRIVAEAVKPEASLSALAVLAERDPGFTLRVLATVNSAAFGLQARVSDVRQAATMLGLRGLRNLALSLVVSDMAPTGPDGELLLANSLRRAAAAQLIAEALGERRCDEYFTVGLLLEVGLIARARDSMPAVAEAALLPATDRILFERAAGAIDHPTRGAQIARDYQLPPEFVIAVGGHHDVEPPEGRLALVAWAAERVAAIWESGNPAEAQADATAALQRAGIDPARAQEVLDRIPSLVTEAASAFQRAVPVQQKLGQLLVDANRILFQMNRNYEGMLRRLESLLKEKEDLTQKLQTANEQLATLAATDSLTGLLNKRSLEEALARDLARADRAQEHLGLVMLDVDFFKKVNDTHGHQVGDEVLKAVSHVVASSLRSGDVAARYGGEEFVTVLPGSDAEGATLVAERIRKRLEQTEIKTSKGVLKVTASFGAASVRGPDCRGAAKDLIARADAALYEAKRTGRNRVVAAAAKAR
jgi:diguanylate cyclase (GGDEF)-like protein